MTGYRTLGLWGLIPRSFGHVEEYTWVTTKSNRANRPFWQIDLANRPKSSLASQDLHSAPKSDERSGAPILTANS